MADPPSHEMMDMSKREAPVPEASPVVTPEMDVGHPMHMTPYEDRIIRVVRDVGKRCCNDDPNKRPTAADVKDFFKRCMPKDDDNPHRFF